MSLCCSVNRFWPRCEVNGCSDDSQRFFSCCWRSLCISRQCLHCCKSDQPILWWRYPNFGGQNSKTHETTDEKFGVAITAAMTPPRQNSKQSPHWGCFGFLFLFFVLFSHGVFSFPLLSFFVTSTFYRTLSVNRRTDFYAICVV